MRVWAALELELVEDGEAPDVGVGEWEAADSHDASRGAKELQTSERAAKPKQRPRMAMLCYLLQVMTRRFHDAVLDAFERKDGGETEQRREKGKK